MPRLLIVLVCLLPAAPLRAEEDGERLFETSVRPLLLDRCVGCHGEKKQSQGLRLDSAAALFKGGDSGPAVVPGKPEESLLLQAVKHQDGLEMPPDEKLSDREIEALTQWIRLGAKWPGGELTSQALAADHWAFQPVGNPPLPTTRSQWGHNEIDRFVLSQMEQAGLSPSLQADRRTLIRRAYYTLTGLPPSAEETNAFVADADPLAYEKLVDRLLESPQYGEQQARRWLDVARYADTKGYVYAREERFWTQAWSYRDWVANALNADLPYDRFLLLQLAADQVECREDDLAAMGYLTLGRRFLGVNRDIIDDRIDVVCQGMMALTVGCARCHDHKYDPIPTADYYSLYGVFDSCRERLVPLRREKLAENVRQELGKQQQTLAEQLTKALDESSARSRARVRDYLHAQTELDKYPAQGFDQIFQTDDMLPAFVRQWEAFLYRAKRDNRPAFRHWHAYQALPAENFPAAAAEVTRQLDAETTGVNPLVRAVFSTPPQSFNEVIDGYARLLGEIDKQWQAALATAQAEQKPVPAALPDPAAEELRLLLYGPQAPAAAPAEPVVHTESFVPSAVCTELWQHQGNLERYLINNAVPAAVILEDREQPSEPRIFIRGNSLRQGEEVPRQFLSLLDGKDRQPFRKGSGRLEMARKIIAPENPLTARVMVNRVWGHDFGQGLVLTPSDFGLRAKPPSHPELLDWLTSRFIADGWSLKKLHRLLLLSATFRQSSAGPADPERLRRAEQVDPGNRLLWRMNAHRLTFEELRDSLLAASGQLDRQAGGKPTPMLQAPFNARRTLYCLVDREFLPGTLRVFDFANPDLHIPRRNETTVPQQMLFFLNHPLVIGQARELARRAADDDPAMQVRRLFGQILQREPSETELAEATQFLAAVANAPTPAPPATAADWHYGYGKYEETAQRVVNFLPAPHYTGAAWQGGAAWPDATLGWVQLTATGGHPGNTRDHACIRRWVAPRAMTIAIQSELDHSAAPGDGIRAFIVSSRAGLLQSAAIHQKKIPLNQTLTVEAGETIDFVVDINNVLNSDQYLWTATISEQTAESPAVWNSEADFTPNVIASLTAAEQLAHVLLCTNEFLFVD